MKDRALQAVHKLVDPIAETLADPNSYGFRAERSTADAAGQCFTVLAQRTSPAWVLEVDIKSFFDNISHDWMLESGRRGPSLSPTPLGTGRETFASSGSGHSKPWLMSHSRSFTTIRLESRRGSARMP